MAFANRIVLLLFALTVFSPLKPCKSDNTSNSDCKRILYEDTDVTALLQPAHSVLTYVARLRHNATTNTFEAYSERREPNSMLRGYSPFDLKVLMNDNEAHQQLQITSKYAQKKVKKLVVWFCGSKGDSFISSRNISAVVSSCASVNDIAVIHDIQSLQTILLPVSITSPEITISFSYIIVEGQQDISEFDNYSKEISKQLHTYHSEKRTRTARAVPESRYFIVATSDVIARVSLDGSRNQVLVRNLQNAVALDYDFRRGFIYWTDSALGLIMRSNLDGTSVSTPLNTGLTRPDGLAVDWVTGNVYFTDEIEDIVGVLEPVSLNYSVLFQTGANTRPRAIVLDPNARMMYFTDWGDVGRIEKASMDGTNRTVIHNTSLVWPNALTLDISTQTLYWADANLDKIERSNVNGGGRVVLAQAGVIHPFGIALEAGNLYFTDWSDNSIRYVQTTGGLVRSLSSVSAFSISTLFGIQAVDALRQPIISNPCASGNVACSHICLLSTHSRGYGCACPAGMVLLTEFTCTSISSVADDRYFLVAAQNVIARVSLDGRRYQVLLRNLQNAVAVDYDYRRNAIYWTDSAQGVIMRSTLTGSAVTTVLSTGLTRPDGLAVDWVNNKLYFTDQVLDIIGVFDPVNSNYTILIRTGTGTEPRAIVLDIPNRTMYFTDWGTTARIERATFDGTNRVAIHSTSLVWPNALTLDLTSRTMYWADASLDKIEKSNMDGTNRVLLAQTGVVHPFGIALEGSSVYFTDWSGNTIRTLSSSGGAVTTLHAVSLYTISTIFGIQVVDSSRQPVSTTTEPPTTLAPTTVVTTDAVQPTMPTSIGDEYFLVATRFTIARVSLDGSLHQVLADNLTNAVAIDYNYRTRTIYWTDSTNGIIMQSDFSGSSVSTVVTGLGTPGGLAVDWITNKLYFTDAALDIIGVVDPSGSYNYTILINTGDNTQPRAIVLDPNRRVMYFTDWGGVGRIEKASMDGTNRTVVHNTSLTWPNALALDTQTQTLYWADASLDKIERSSVNGSGRALLAQAGVIHPFSMLYRDSSLYFSDWSDDTIRTLAASGGIVTRLHSVRGYATSRIFGIQIVDSSNQPSFNNPCGSGNGGCSHFCLLSSASAGYSCACPYELILDGRFNCVPIAVNDSRYFIVATGDTIARVSLDGLRYQVLVSGLGNAVAIDYDYRNGLIYWTDTGAGLIMRSNFDGSSVTTLLTDGLIRPDGLAVDWISGVLYFTDEVVDIVARFDPRESNYTVLFNTGPNTRPRAIVLDPNAGMMYFTDWGDVGRIEKASMAGTNRTVIHNTGLVWPNALTLDISTQTLYWADAFLDKVERSNADGTGRVVLARAGVVHPFGIVFENSTVYFTDWSDDTIRYLSAGGGSVGTLHSVTVFSSVNIFGIQVVDILRQFIDVDECLSNPCDMNAVCTDNPGYYNCTCISGYEGDGTTCQDINECSSNPCDANAMCTNQPGSFSCACNSGFAGDGFACLSIGIECPADLCDINAVCTALPDSSLTCTCNSGYSGNGFTCQNIDECASNPCDTNATCTDVPGSFSCACNSGFSGDGFSCEDINDCADQPCDIDAMCNDTSGSFTCTCLSGYSGNGFSCKNIDECVLEKPCSANARCIDTDGSYVCTCKDNFKGDGVNCKANSNTAANSGGQSMTIGISSGVVVVVIIVIVVMAILVVVMYARRQKKRLKAITQMADQGLAISNGLYDVIN